MRWSQLSAREREIKCEELRHWRVRRQTGRVRYIWTFPASCVFQNVSDIAFVICRYVQFLSKAYISPVRLSVCFAYFVLNLWFVLITWWHGKQVVSKFYYIPLVLCLGRVWVFYCIFQTEYFTMVVTAGWHSPPLWAEFSSLVVTAVITIPASGLRLMSLTCLANIKSITLSLGRRPGVSLGTS